MNEPNDNLEFRAGLDSSRGGDCATEFDENFCLQCEAEIPHGYEFCDFECEQAWHSQRRAERKLRG